MPKYQITLSEFGKILLFAALYFLTAKAGLHFDPVAGYATLIWPPSGLSLAAIVLFGYRLWPGIALGAFAVNYSIGGSLVVASGIAVGNTLEALCGALLLQRVAEFNPRMQRLRDVFAFISFGAVISTLIGATFGAASVHLIDPVRPFPLVWITWWQGDLLGALVIAPFCFAWLSGYPKGSFFRIVEKLGFGLTLLFISYLSFGLALGRDERHLRIWFLTFPHMIWSALRFGMRGTTLTILAFSGTAIWFNVQDSWKYDGGQLTQNLWLVELYITIFAITGYIVSAIMSEREASRTLVQQHMSDLQRAEDALRDRSKELERSNRDLEQFAFVASHDLQSPLRTVEGFLKLLEDRYHSDLDPAAKRLVDQALQGALRMQTIIQDLLTFSRVNPKGVVLADVDTAQAVLEVTRNLGAEIKESQAEINTHDLPTILASRALFTQLMQNLVTNAIKFRDAKSPKVEVSCASKENEWIFSIKDNGIGIDAHQLNNIFGLFQRLHAGRGKYPGNGIGLAVCRKIVESHGGRIWVESQPGQGSTFFFSIPRVPLAGRVENSTGPIN